ncbi:MAG: hypothetical protein JXA64_04485 [Candidatus Fermentibacteraceae bacterium]|nr:hypothetical protein [Candidatus Fermentibacteraceae bacterium]MBN2608351.1 hypothetical protein [Candidatus Fermentibacteraceae bacterium]
MMFFGLENRYPDSLGELVAIDPRLVLLSCPSCSLPYLYETDGFDNYFIGCPLPDEPNHGYMENGQAFWPPDPSTWPNVCHGNMIGMSMAIAMFFGQNDRYPENLDELVNQGLIPQQPFCPACSSLYIYSTDGQNTYTIVCPLPVDPNHGWITDGECSWPPDTSGCTDFCHSNMCCLASAMAMYYGRYNRYPEELSLLGTSGTMENWDRPCPACGRIYHYWTDEEGQIYLIQCPLPWDPGHGSVYDGMISW